MQGYMNPDGGGWAEVRASDFGLPGRVYVRFAEVEGRLEISELYIDGRGEPIPPRALRQFPIGDVASLFTAGQPDHVRDSLDSAAVDLSRLASYHAGGQSCYPKPPRRAGSPYAPGRLTGYQGEVCEHCGAPLLTDDSTGETRAITDWVALSLLAQQTVGYPAAYDAPAVPQAEYAKPHKWRRGDLAEEELVLYDPENGLTDEFLSDVAAAYRVAVAKRLHPAQAIADLPTIHAGVRTVHSWIYKARKRGFLTPTAPRKG